MHGTPEVLMADAEVQRAYFGGAH
ncbi:hypothetical protein [Klebsiella aerogenes]